MAVASTSGALRSVAPSNLSGIEVEGLTKSFGEVAVLTGIDFNVQPGAVLALLGPNGAGKTTTVRILATLLRPDGGRALVGGYNVATEPVRARSVLGLTGQETSVDGLLTGRENLVMLGRLWRLSTVDAARRAGELLDLMDLQEAADRQVNTYSGGMRRRLDLAASLVAAPTIMFLDEPTTGLDPVARQKVWDAIRDLIGKGTTVLLTTQYLSEADLLADRVVVIDEGRVVVDGTPRSLKRQVGSERAELAFRTGDDLSTALSLLADLKPLVDEKEQTLALPIKDPWQLHTTLGRLRDADLEPLQVTVAQPTLDDVFIAFTGSRRPTTSEETL
jgi:daunorubicin resistance ABC transporter ATP-binding subunit